MPRVDKKSVQSSTSHKGEARKKNQSTKKLRPQVTQCSKKGKSYQQKRNQLPKNQGQRKICLFARYKATQKMMIRTHETRNLNNTR